MDLKYSSPEQIAIKYRWAVSRLINRGDFTGWKEARKILRIRQYDLEKPDWTPSKRNVILIVKGYQVNAIWLYFQQKSTGSPLFQPSESKMNV